MNCFGVKLKMKWCLYAYVLVMVSALSVTAHPSYGPEHILDNAAAEYIQPDIMLLDHHDRQKRELPPAPSPSAPSAAMPANLTHQAASTTVPSTPAAISPETTATTPVNANAAVTVTKANLTDDSNRTTKLAKPSSTPVASVTQVPILGANGTGQRWTNLSDTTPKVSDPISADDNFTDVYETPEMVKAERNFTNLKYDNHTFYNSSFIGDPHFFAEHWANITSAPAHAHDMLSNSHRKATTVKLSFSFPFYGNWIQTVTVATGGFIYTGEHTHSWLAATQYIAPLMANFDTSLDNTSRISMADDGEKFTAFWENVALREQPNKLFTFAVTLYKNGDIVFSYKHIPLAVQEIDDKAHPVKIGISDAYFTDKIIFYVRRKTVYEYHRVSFKNYEITNGTVLKLTALPTCVQYTTCDTCLNHNTTFPCAWCENIKKCSSGTDRNKQDWQLRNCDNTLVTNATSCPAVGGGGGDAGSGNSSRAAGTYVTDGRSGHDADVRTLNMPDKWSKTGTGPGAGAHAGEPEAIASSITQAGAGVGAAAGSGGGSSAVGGAAAACTLVALVCALAAWALYAFRNPHTRSGQLFIKYRPSQWNWRRGEARYTAATIHM